MEEIQQWLFTLIGAIICFISLVNFIWFLKYFFPRVWSQVPESFFQSMGEWAVITGAGDGIGKAYSIELAKRGLNTVLISRTLETLKKVASEIEEATGRSVKIIQADFTKNDIYDDIETSLQGLEIGILGSHQLQHDLSCQDPHDYPPETMIIAFERILKEVFKITLDGMQNDTDSYETDGIKRDCSTREQLGKGNSDFAVNSYSQWFGGGAIYSSFIQKGLILNIASAVGTFPCPLYTIYSASKAFVYTFSKALQVEYKEKGIIIQVVTPYGVSTPMSMNPKPNLITKSAQDFARESLDYVRLSDETHGCLAHEILALFLHFVPLWVFHSDKVQEAFLRMVAEYQKKTQKST